MYVIYYLLNELKTYIFAYISDRMVQFSNDHNM